MIVFTQFYPKYFDEDEIEKDIEIIGASGSYKEYKEYGGILDKLTYFEVLSKLRENRINSFFTLKLSEGVKVKAVNGEEYFLQIGDRIRGTLT
jgi:hypothetical protein